MKRMIVSILLVCAAAGSILTGLRADDSDKEKTLRASLIGTWKLISAKYDGQENDLPKTSPTIKHVTPAGFVFLSYDKDTGKMSRAGGGTYTLKGETYTETIEYGMGDDFEAIKNASHSFTCKIDGDKWRHDGKLANGLTIEEVWERAKPKVDTKASKG
jgi:hypothetical protein